MLLWPVNPIISAGAKEPTAVVADWPDRPIVGSDVKVKAPTVVVADNADGSTNVTPAVEIVPNVLVADWPDKPTEWSSSVNNPCEDIKPIPVSVKVRSDLTNDKEFNVDVADKPVSPTTSLAITVPREVVAV